MAASMEWMDYPAQEEGVEHTVVGNLKVIRDLESPQLGNRRDLLAYLPPSYPEGERRYPVIYMHDGQNLFDSATAFGDEWHVDETLEAASRRGLEAIVIGIPNAGEQRCDEYSPFVDEKNGGGRGDEYLRFITDTVKPLVDGTLRTLPERRSTGIAGSSMGGLISLYGFFRCPEVFGFAGVMSPSLWFADGAIFPYVEAAAFVPGRLYLDVGTEEGERTLQDARRMRDMLCDKGYCLHGYDAEGLLRYLEDRGAGHTESAWAGRLRGELRFLLRPFTPRADGSPAAMAGPVEGG